MNPIKWIFYPRYLDVIWVPLLIVIVFVIVMFILSYIFVKIELNNINKDRKEKEVKNEK